MISIYIVDIFFIISNFWSAICMHAFFYPIYVNSYMHAKSSNKLSYFLFRSTGDSSYFYLYRISYMWYSPLGFLITFIFGLLVSNLFRLCFKNQKDELDANLFFPVIARRIRYRRHNDIENEGSSPLDRKYSFSDVIPGKDNSADKICTKL